MDAWFYTDILSDLVLVDSTEKNINKQFSASLRKNKVSNRKQIAHQHSWRNLPHI